MARGDVSVTVRIKGVKESLAAMQGIKKNTGKGAAVGLKKAMEYLLAESNKITPKKTGALRRSGKVIITGKGKDVVGKIIYTSPYAVWVHECVTDYHESPTKAKFLELTVRNPLHQGVASAMITSEIARYQAMTPGVRLRGSIRNLFASFFGGR